MSCKNLGHKNSLIRIEKGNFIDFDDQGHSTRAFSKKKFEKISCDIEFPSIGLRKK